MLRRKLYKKEGKNAFYRNWASCIIICFLATILVGGTIFTINKEFDYRTNIKSLDIRNIEGDSNSDIVNEFINGLRGSKPISNKFLNTATRGVIGTLSNSVSKTGSFLFGLLNALNELLFKDRIWPSVIIIVGAVISLFYWIFVSKVLEVGRARFFLENHRYTKTKVNRLIFPFKIRKSTHIAYTMFLKNLYTILWSFTFIGGIIKYYSYKMVPYILAENPNMKPKDVLKLSKEMTSGYKWELFKLDISFIGYYFLGLLTFNVSNVVFTTPYINATYAEVYMYLRDLAKTRACHKAELLKDNLLDGEVTFSEYPIYDKMLAKTNRLLRFDYNRKYKLTYLILICLIISILGFCWETVLYLFQHGEIVKRGTLHGPWLPIYGGGCLALLVLLKPFRKNPFTYFALSLVVCGIIEYCTSLYLEAVHHLTWWSYNGYFLNINGRICLEGLILFGVGGVFATYILAPLIANFLDKLSRKTRIILCCILVFLLGLDFYISSTNPNTGKGITNKVSSSSLKL